MDLKPYVDYVRQELMVAADAGGDEARALAARLVAPLESAMRLTLLNALSNAADEITRDLAPGSVDLRLRGLEPSFVVTSPPTEPFAEPHGAAMAPSIAPSAAPSAAAEGDEATTARINFRPPERLKARIEEAAGAEGLSVNAWLVRAVARVLDTGSGRSRPSTSSIGQSYTGWAR